jgi:cyclopropane-fatty-acyl-phospholipid synthase
LTRVVNILAAISITPVTRLPMHKSPSWHALGQSFVYSQIRKFWILTVGGAGIANALWEMQPDISVTGITLSENQHAYATQKAKQGQRQQHLAFHICDYRHQRGSFDRIVSVGMLEHVGMRHFDSYFASIARLLAPNGVALVHSIGVHHNAKRCNRWLNKYIFPGG